MGAIRRACRRRTAQQPFRDLLAERTAEPDAGQGAGKQSPQQLPVHRPGRGVPEARDQRERHGMGDVGADDARNCQAGVKEKQDRHTQRAGAYRGNRDQDPEYRAERDGALR